MFRPLSIAIDIGGTNTAFGFVTEEGEVIFKNEIETGNSPDPGELVGRLTSEISENIRNYEKTFKIVGAGIGAPNGNYFNGTIEFPPNLFWKGITPLAKMVSEKLSMPVILTNDANAGALGELYFGSGIGMKDFLFITLGTGLGSGIIANGELIYGRHGFAGELGHTIIIQHGRQCGCGRKGCLEQYCSATGLVKTYHEILTSQGKTVQDDNADKKIDSKYIFDKAMGGDEAAFYAFKYTGELLGFALSNFVAFSDPEAIFLFGGLARAEEILFNPLKINFEKCLQNIYKNKIKILASGLPENNAALLGASSLIWNELKKNK